MKNIISKQTDPLREILEDTGLDAPSPGFTEQVMIRWGYEYSPLRKKKASLPPLTVYILFVALLGLVLVPLVYVGYLLLAEFSLQKLSNTIYRHYSDYLPYNKMIQLATFFIKIIFIMLFVEGLLRLLVPVRKPTES